VQKSTTFITICKKSTYRSVQVEPVKLPFDLVLHHDPVHRKQNVPPVPRYDHVVPDVVVEQTPDAQAGHYPRPQIDLEQQPVVSQLQSYVIPLGAPAVEDDTARHRRLEPEPDALARRRNWIPHQVQLQQRSSVEVHVVGL
jgi:hypothetical protein